MTNDRAGVIDAYEQQGWRRKTRWWVMFVALASASTACGNDGTGSSATELTLGGRMYDEWWAGTGAEPGGTFELYAQTAGTQTGATTWRCKECHGWDYRGVEGRYGSGSHFTGVRGLLDLTANRSESQLFAAIKLGTPPSSDSQLNALHAFGGVMSDSEIRALVRFLREGMLDMSTVIGPASGQIAGDAGQGAALYATDGAGTCESCHDADGRRFNFGDAEEPEYVGTIAADNPWEGLHKIRWGHPGSMPQMPSAVAEGLQLTEQADILRHCQTLPTD
jgi:cytochrome c553